MKYKYEKLFKKVFHDAWNIV